MQISSKDNSLIKHIKKLKDKKYRDEYGEYIIEGLKFIGEAVKENAEISHIIICEGCDKSEIIENHLRYEMAKYNCIYVPQEIFKLISDTQNPQGILAVLKKNKEQEQIDYNTDLIIALDDIQDPGNFGTIIRTVDSIGAKQILISKGTVDCYNPKVVRSTMGAIFRTKIFECENLKDELKQSQKNGFKIMCTSLNTKKTIYDVNYLKKVIVIGNEANGISKEVQNLANEKVTIPMFGKTESLNASVATGIILYEYVRQKRLMK